MEGFATAPSVRKEDFAGYSRRDAERPKVNSLALALNNLLKEARSSDPTRCGDRGDGQPGTMAGC